MKKKKKEEEEEREKQVLIAVRMELVMLFTCVDKAFFPKQAESCT